MLVAEAKKSGKMLCDLSLRRFCTRVCQKGHVVMEPVAGATAVEQRCRGRGRCPVTRTGA